MKDKQANMPSNDKQILSTSHNLDMIGDFIFASEIEDGSSRPIDYLLVLGAPHIELMERAASIFVAGGTRKIIACGKYSMKTGRVMYEKLPRVYRKPYDTEATMMKDIMCGMGVPETAILCESASTNILENLENGMRIAFDDAFANEEETSVMQKQKLSIGICCQSFCSRRVAMAFDSLGYETEAERFLFRANTQGISYNDWRNDDYARKRVFGELRRCGEYFE